MRNESETTNAVQSRSELALVCALEPSLAGTAARMEASEVV